MNREKNYLKKVKTPGLSVFELKLIALITMLIDHTAACLIAAIPGATNEESTWYAIYWAMRLIGRIAFPIYCFLLVEGFNHTKNKVHYLIRLSVFCIISELPFNLALSDKLFYYKHQNVFFTLTLGFLLMQGFEYASSNACYKHIQSFRFSLQLQTFIKYFALLGSSAYFTYKTAYYFDKYTSISVKSLFVYLISGIICLSIIYYMIKKTATTNGDRNALILCQKIIILAVLMLIADIFHTDYSSAGVLTIAVMYIYKNDYFKRQLAGCLALTALSDAAELTSFITVPLLQKYNGKLGPKYKYFFYVVYPLHLLILYFIRHF